MKFTVKGICFIPHEASCEVEAENEQEALLKALEMWAENKRQMIDTGSGDDSAAFDWEPQVT